MRVIESPTQTTIGNQILSAKQRPRIEVVSQGIDEALQGVGSSPYGGVSWTGLRVPTLATPAASPQLRYLFMLCSFTLSEGVKARLVGFRQGWSLGQIAANNRIVEQFVQDPWFKGPNFNVSWHLRKQTMNEPRVPNPSAVVPAGVGVPLQNFASRASDTPALLFQSATAPNPFYTSLTAYVPPNAGRPWGTPLAPEFGTFFDLKTNWRDGSDWYSTDLPFEGPCRIQFYASVNQRNLADPRPLVMPAAAVTAPSTVLNFPLGLSADEQFLQNFVNAIVWRVAGAMMVEFEDFEQFRSYEIDGRKCP